MTIPSVLQATAERIQTWQKKNRNVTPRKWLEIMNSSMYNVQQRGRLGLHLSLLNEKSHDTFRNEDEFKKWATGFSRMCTEFDTVVKNSGYSSWNELMTPFLIFDAKRLHNSRS